MELALPVVWSDSHRLHEPGAEVYVGVRTPGTEVPLRADAIRAALTSAGALFVDAVPHDDKHVLAVHDAALVDYLRGAWEEWSASGLTADPGQDRVVPYLFPLPGLLGDLPARSPASVAARAGRFCFDTMTLIGPGTWEAARAAADVALTAAELVASGEVLLAYACCRPPGHHVTRTVFGGSCYLNNAAAAAVRLRSGLGGGRVAVLDIDAHHGNGAQSIFWDEPGVLTGSVHVDPGAGWFPHYLGFATENSNSNRNLPLAPGTGDDGWLAAVAELSSWAQAGGAHGLVVALGVDAAAGDPESPLRVSADGYFEAGRLLGGLGLPTVVVQEGGYDLETIGELVVCTLAGLEAGHGTALTAPPTP